MLRLKTFAALAAIPLLWFAAPALFIDMSANETAIVIATVAGWLILAAFIAIVARKEPKPD